MSTTHINRHIMTGELPRVKVKPVIGDLHLVPIDNLLLENSILVPQTVSPGREVQRCQAVEETGGKSAEAAIAESGVVLLLNNILDAESKIRKADLTQEY